MFTKVLGKKQTNHRRKMVTSNSGRGAFGATFLAIDILSTLVLFRNFAEWGDYPHIEGKVVGGFACIYVVSFWLTTRSSFRIYSQRLFFLDLLSLFILANLPSAIHANHPLWGYGPSFWLGLSVVELLNLDWNNALRRESPSVTAKSDYTRWWILTAVSVALGVGVFFYLRLGHTRWLGIAAAAVAIIFHMWMILRWNLDRYRRQREEGASFLDV